MITYCAGRCDTEAVAGTVRLEMRFSSSKQVFAIFSPEAARFMARQLTRLAADAEAWVAPDANEEEPCAACEAMPTGKDGRADFCKAHREAL